MMDEENKQRFAELEAMLKRVKDNIGMDKPPKPAERSRSITEYSLNSWHVCDAELGKLFVHGHYIETKADLTEFIAILQKAAEVANLQ